MSAFGRIDPKYKDAELNNKLMAEICDDMNVCNVVKTESLIQEELKLAILKRATMYEKDMIEKIVKENKKNPGIKLSDIKKAIDGQN